MLSLDPPTHRSRRWPRLLLALAAAVLACLGGAAASPAAKFFVVLADPGGLPNSGPVLRYDVAGPTSVPTFESTIADASFDHPCCLSFGPTGEMFVSNRFDDSAPELSGSITRILHPEGAWTPNGTITSPLFSQPHLSAFRDGELFVAQRGFNNNFVLRFVFDATGAATFNGVINTGLTFAAPCGAAVSPRGELFIAQGCGVNQINRYLFDSAGDAVPNGTITGPTVCGPGAMAFSATGELFVNNPCADAVSRFTFDSSGNASANGLITAPTLHSPQGVAFSPWGELFVSNLNLPSVISRWTFDNAGNAVFNGSFALPQATADLRFGPSAEPPPNRPPDCSHVALTPAQLWPPNHRYVDVTATGATDPDAGDTATLTIDSVTQDEPVDGRGDGHTAPDATLTAPRSDHVAIRAERSTFGDGRVYRVHYTATDTRDASCAGHATVSVPRHHGERAIAPPYNSLRR